MNARTSGPRLDDAYREHILQHVLCDGPNWETSKCKSIYDLIAAVTLRCVFACSSNNGLSHAPRFSPRDRRSQSPILYTHEVNPPKHATTPTDHEQPLHNSMHAHVSHYSPSTSAERDEELRGVTAKRKYLPYPACRLTLRDVHPEFDLRRGNSKTMTYSRENARILRLAPVHHAYSMPASTHDLRKQNAQSKETRPPLVCRVHRHLPHAISLSNRASPPT